LRWQWRAAVQDAGTMKERKAITLPGVLFFFLLLGAGIILVMNIISQTGRPGGESRIFLIPVLLVVIFILMKGLFIVPPNEARVLTFLGKYTGSVRENGIWFANPFASKRRISLKVANFQCPQLKVNDAHGNPIEIAAVIVWRVVDSAKALFEVEDYQEFVHIQCETALRHMANHYPYEPHVEGEISLRGNPTEVSARLLEEVQQRVSLAGVEIIETQLTHLAYSPEIAQAMLRRQQASAVLSARQIIVDGAVGMVEIALKRLEQDGIVQLDQASRALMVNNLLVTLVSESHMQPVLPTASVKS
jgi:regulator of protease activity HflC (stomatin/prohibitin superfamily)